MGRRCGKPLLSGQRKSTQGQTEEQWRHPFTSTKCGFKNGMPDAFDVPRGAGILFTTPSASQLANLPGSGTTGQTRTDYHHSASLSGKNFLNGQPIKNKHWSTHNNNLPADRVRNSGQTNQILDFQCFLLNCLTFNILCWASRKQDVEKLKYWELIYVQALCIRPPGLCKKDA